MVRFQGPVDQGPRAFIAPGPFRVTLFWMSCVTPVCGCPVLRVGSGWSGGLGGRSSLKRLHPTEKNRENTSRWQLTESTESVQWEGSSRWRPTMVLRRVLHETNQVNHSFNGGTEG